MIAKEVMEYILQKEDISGLELCRRLNVGNDTVRSVTSGKVCKISTTLADGIVELFPHYNKLWILTGEGEILANSIKKEPSTEDSMKKLVNELLITVNMMQEQLRAAMQLVEATNKRADQAEQQMHLQQERNEQSHSEFLAVLKMMREMSITFAPMTAREPHPGMVAEDSPASPKEE